MGYRKDTTTSVYVVIACIVGIAMIVIFAIMTK